MRSTLAGLLSMELISDRFVRVLISSLRTDWAGHSMRKCRTFSSSWGHTWHFPSGWCFKRNRCWFRAHFPIRSFEIKIFLLEAHWNLPLVDTSFSIVLWCWLRGSETHLVCHCWMMLWPTALLTSLIDAGIQRSICSLVMAAFANASAFSLPGIPTWAGIQTSVTFLPLSYLILIVLKALLGSLAENWAFIGVTVLGIIAKDEFACSFMRKVELLHFFILVHFGLCRDLLFFLQI